MKYPKVFLFYFFNEGEGFFRRVITGTFAGPEECYISQNDLFLRCS